MQSTKRSLSDRNTNNGDQKRRKTTRKSRTFASGCASACEEHLHVTNSTQSTIDTLLQNTSQLQPANANNISTSGSIVGESNSTPPNPLPVTPTPISLPQLPYKVSSGNKGSNYHSEEHEEACSDESSTTNAISSSQPKEIANQPHSLYILGPGENLPKYLAYYSCSLCPGSKFPGNKNNITFWLYHVVKEHGVTKVKEKCIHVCETLVAGNPCNIATPYISRHILTHIDPTVPIRTYNAGAAIYSIGEDGDLPALTPDNRCTLCPNQYFLSQNRIAKFHYHVKQDHGVNKVNGKLIYIYARDLSKESLVTRRTSESF